MIKLALLSAAPAGNNGGVLGSYQELFWHSVALLVLVGTFVAIMLIDSDRDGND